MWSVTEKGVFYGIKDSRKASRYRILKLALLLHMEDETILSRQNSVNIICFQETNHRFFKF